MYLHEMRSFKLGVAFIALAACGSSSTTTPIDASIGDGALSTLTPEQQTAKLCDDIVPSFCDALFGCCSDPTTQAQFDGSAAACKTKLASSCKTDLGDPILASVKAGVTVLDPTRLAICVAKLSSMKAGGAACVRPPQYVLLDCVDAFRGQLAPGAACDASTLPDMHYVPCKDGACTSGVCAAFIPSGGACNPQNDNSAAAWCNYADGYSCFGSGTTGTCMPRGAVGASCTTGSAFSCESAACVSGKCIAPSADLLCKGG